MYINLILYMSNPHLPETQVLNLLSAVVEIPLWCLIYHPHVVIMHNVLAALRPFFVFSIFYELKIKTTISRTE